MASSGLVPSSGGGGCRCLRPPQAHPLLTQVTELISESWQEQPLSERSLSYRLPVSRGAPHSRARVCTVPQRSWEEAGRLCRWSSGSLSLQVLGGGALYTLSGSPGPPSVWTGLTAGKASETHRAVLGALL